MAERPTQYLETILSLIEEMRFTSSFYSNLQKEAFPSREELGLASIKMQYAKEQILKKSFALKRALKSFEAHL